MNRYSYFQLIKIPVILLSFFYFYFGWIIHNVYSLYYIGYGAFFLLPRLFTNSFIWFYFVSCIFILLQLRPLFFRVASFLLFPVSILYLIQYFSLYYSRNYLISEAFAELNAIGIFLTKTNILVSLSFFVFVFLFWSLFQRRRVDKYKNVYKIIAIQLVFTSILFSFSFLSYYLYQKYSRNYASAFPSPKELPEFAF